MQDTTLQTDMPPRLRWWDMALPLLGGAIVFALITFGVAMLAITKGDAGFIERFAERMQSAEQGYALNMGVMAALYLPPLIVMFWIARRKGLEYFSPVALRVICWALAGGVLYAVAFQAAQDFLINHGIVSYTPSPGELLLVPHNVVQLALGLGLAAIFGPFVEEFYFRGMLLSWSRRRMPLVWAGILNAVLFGVVHLYFLQHAGLEGIFVTAVMALFGGLNVWWVVRTGSLWPAFASHAAYNGVGLFLMFLFPGGV